MKLYAIKRPDGSLCPPGRTEPAAWDAAGRVDDALWNEWYKHDTLVDSAFACKQLGYRCVEVEVVEVEK